MLLLILGSHINNKKNTKKIKKIKKMEEKKINEKNIPKRTGNYRRLVEKDQNI
jgi:hypothetical protein